MTEDSRTTLADRVDPVSDWSTRRTYRASDFRAGDLVAAKADRRISVVLPARDEAATVGPIVSALRTELVDRVPLIDELVVVDLPTRMLRAVDQHHRQAVPELHRELPVPRQLDVRHLQARTRGLAERDQLAVDADATAAALAGKQGHRVHHGLDTARPLPGCPRMGCLRPEEVPHR